MIFKSPYNGKEFSIPDEKLPDAPKFAMKCPFTGKKMVFERVGDKYDVVAGEKIERPAAPKPDPEPKKPVLQLPQVEPEVYPPGAKVAFLFLKDGTWVEGAKSYFQGKGYHLSVVEDELEAIALLRLGEYDVLVAQDGDISSLLQDEVSAWPGGKRRYVNFVLVGEDARSNDPKAAFVKGANTYLALSDGAQAGDLLEGALTGYELYYQLLDMAYKQLEQ